MESVADAGYRAISFGMRGYGESSAPPDVDDYTLFKIADDLVEICTALQIQGVTAGVREEFCRPIEGWAVELHTTTPSDWATRVPLLRVDHLAERSSLTWALQLKR